MSTIDIPDKICPHCNNTKWRVEYRKKPTKDNPDNTVIRYRCSTRANERGLRWRQSHVEQYKAYDRICSRNKRANGYYKSPRVREAARLKAKKESNELAPNFLKREIMQSINTKNIKYISRSDIPQELLETKRKQLLLTRQIKNNGKDN